MKKILTLLLPLLTFGAGTFGGTLLRGDPPPHEPATEAAAPAGPDADADGGPAQDGPATGEHEHGRGGPAAWFTFPSQFFVPMMRNGDMGAMMILTLSIETTESALEPMKSQEHRLRDALLRQLLILANTGAFDGNFTTEPRTRVLREALLRSVRDATDLPVDAVLIEEIARQAGS